MSWILFIFYLGFFVLIIKKIKFFDDYFLSKKILTLIFIIKISIGVSLNFIYKNYYGDENSSDIYKYFNDSKHIHQSLLKNPIHFLQLLTGYNDDDIYLKCYVDSTLNWKYQSNFYSELTKTNSNTFSNHKTMTKFNAIVRVFSFGNISIHVLFMCFLSLIGCFLIYKTYLSFIPNSNFKLFIGTVFLLPSILIWSSGILKEGLIVFGFGVFIYSLMKFSKKDFNWKYFTGFIFSIFLLFITKYYIVIILIPIAFIFLIYLHSSRLILFKYLFSILFFSILFFNNNSIYSFFIDTINSKRNEQERISYGGNFYIQFDHNNFQRLVTFKDDVSDFEYPCHNKSNRVDSSLFMIKSGLQYRILNNGQYSDFFLTDTLCLYYFMDSYKQAGSYYDLPTISDKSALEFIKSSSISLFNVLTKPFQLNEGSIMLRLASLENLGLIFLIIFLFVKRRIKIRNLNLLIFNLLFTIQLFIIIGLTTPVLGGLFRYKILGLILFVISLLMIFDKRKI